MQRIRAKRVSLTPVFSEKVRNGLLILIIFVCFISAGCDNPKTPGIAEAWQKNMKEGLIQGYTDFTPQWLDSDIAAYIFTYKCPSSISSKEVFSIIRKQISGFSLETQSETTLVLRKGLSYSGPGGFDEWQFLYDENTKIMTVLFANLDSPTERKAYTFVLDKLRHYHTKEVEKRKKALNQALKRIGEKSLSPSRLALCWI